MESNAQVAPTSSKNQQILNLISEYKKYISQTQLKDEVYKWELLNKFKGRPDVNAQNFENEYKSVKFADLMYHLLFSVGKHICREKPEEFRQLFVRLFDEKTDHSMRVRNFNEESLALYRSLGEEKGHHQDDRAISVYLTFHNPEKYTFYKSTFYSDFCDLLEIPTAGKNERYTHYLELLSDFIEKYIIPDTELIETVKSLIPEYYDGTHHLLLAQDILYSMLNKFKEDVNYWIFQGNPKIYDFVEARNKGAIDQWTATAHRDKMKIGDKVIFWLTGADAGCYALGEITSEPFENKEEQDEFWKKEDKTEWKVGVKVTHDLSTSPILREIVDSTEEFRELKVGHQGTNFAASKQEYDSFVDIINSRKTGAYIKIKKALDNNKLQVFISILKKFTTDHHLKENDPRISFNIIESYSRLVFVIGGRYSLCIEKKNKETILSFISEHDITNTTVVPFKSKKGVVEAYWNHFNFDKQSEFEKLGFDGLNSELQRNYHCNYKNFSNHEFAADILGESKVKYWIYAPGLNAIMWDEFYNDGLMGLEWDILGDLNTYKSKEEISLRLKELENSESSKTNDASANYDFKENMAIGDIVIAKKGRSAYLGYGEVVSDYYFDDLAQNYKHRRRVNWKKKGLWNSEHQIVLKTLTDITNLPYKPNPSLLAPQAILNIINGPNSEEMNHQPLNQILYGPPGTGKTYELKSHYFPKYTSQESSISAEQHFKNVVSECSWWQVIAL
ncbi:MAG: EVE domain-containing protein, partial [Bacteroidota bacterium]